MSASATDWSWRCAGWTRGRRLAVLLLFAGVAVWGAVAASVSPVDRPEPPDGKADVDFYSVVVEQMRGGRGYYDVIDTEQAARGFPTTPFVTVREPTLAWFLSTFPPIATTVVFVGLGVVLMGLALRTFDLTERRRSMWVSMVLLSALMMVIYGGNEAKTFHEVWTTLLLTIGLLATRLGSGRYSMGAVLVASLVRELVAPVMPIMAVLAWRAGRRREAVEWMVMTAVFSAFYAWHVRRVETEVTSVSIESPGWITWRGWPGAVDAFGSSSILVVVPAAVASALLALGILGWVMRRGPVFDPIAAVVLFYTVLLCVAGRDDTWYWGYYVGGIIVVGVPMGVAALVAMVSRRDGPRCTTDDPAS